MLAGIGIDRETSQFVTMTGGCRGWPCLSCSPRSPGSGSPAAPASGQRGAKRADPEGGCQRAPPGNQVTGALATKRGRDPKRKSEAGGQISRELPLRANSKCRGPGLLLWLVAVQTPGGRDDASGHGHLLHPAMETSASQEQQQPAAAKIRNLPW